MRADADLVAAVREVGDTAVFLGLICCRDEVSLAVDSHYFAVSHGVSLVWNGPGSTPSRVEPGAAKGCPGLGFHGGNVCYQRLVIMVILLGLLSILGFQVVPQFPSRKLVFAPFSLSPCVVLVYLFVAGSRTPLN